MEIWKSVTSRVYCSREARREFSSVLKVTKPVEVQIDESPDRKRATSEPVGHIGRGKKVDKDSICSTISI